MFVDGVSGNPHDLGNLPVGLPVNEAVQRCALPRRETNYPRPTHDDHRAFGP